MRRLWLNLSGDPREPYALTDAEGNVVRLGSDPKRLSDWGLHEGEADEVRHDYNLREAEDAENARYAKIWKAAK